MGDTVLSTASGVVPLESRAGQSGIVIVKHGVNNAEGEYAVWALWRICYGMIVRGYMCAIPIQVEFSDAGNDAGLSLLLDIGRQEEYNAEQMLDHGPYCRC
jgi:hypothetical protein